MSKFVVLSGKSLAKAIKGFGAKVASFSQLTPQLGYSALAHVEEHSCASHLNALFAATPMNYRNALRVWACDLGKVSFVAKPEDGASFFVFAKGSTSDLAAAMETGPVEYARAEKGADEKAFDELAAFEAFAKKLGAKGASAQAIALVEGAIRALKSPATKGKRTIAKAVEQTKPSAPTVVVNNTPSAALELDLAA